MERILRNRRAHGLDTIFAIASIFGLVIFTLVITYTYDEFVDKAKNTTINDTSQAITALEDVGDVNEMWDFVILFIFIGFALAMIILGYFIDVHTIFFPFFIIVMLIGVIIAGVLSYTWDKITETSMFSAIELSHFPIMSHIMEYLILYYVIIATLALIATYSKTGDRV